MTIHLKSNVLENKTLCKQLIHSLTPHNDSCFNLKYECHEAVISQKERYNTYVMI